MHSNIDIQPACDVVSVTGESPVWSSRDNALYWVDVRSNRIFRMSASGSVTDWDVGERVSSVGFRRDGGLIGTFRSGIYAIDISACGTQATKTLIVSPELAAGTRPKEGKADASGCWWFGSTCDANEPLGGYFRLFPDGHYVQISDGVTMANGLAVNASGDKVLAADSITNTIWSWSVDLESNTLAERQVFSRGEGVTGLIDGATFDDEGYYWCALFGEWAIARYSPDGRLVRKIQLPVKYPTMCAFGGENLDTLFVTSSQFHAVNDTEGQPLAGRLFKIDGLGSRGINEREFG
jgi:L-arabinonolactonase